MTTHHHSVRLVATLRLFALFVVLAFSFGGFSFYAAVVVPIGGQVFDVTSQGFVTQQVTQVLNLSSGVTLFALVWEAIAVRADRRPWENRILTVLLLILGICLLTLVALHPQLTALMQDQDFSVSDPERFYALHRVYLWTSSIQWLATLPVVWLVCSLHPPRSAVASQPRAASQEPRTAGKQLEQ